jgi:hypothetical protein
MVLQPDEIRDDLSDDDSYDYCEDVYSLHSTGQTMSTGAEATDNLLHKDMVLTVPSVLMQNLDEAHAAAELAQIPDLEQLGDDNSEVSSTTSVQERDDVSSHVEKDWEQKPVTQPAASTMSRASNKKRRKKLKLMKKALAAESAAQLLSERARSATKSSSPPKSQKLKSWTTGVRSSKKVANIAVACATETYAAYREELLTNKQTCA